MNATTWKMSRWLLGLTVLGAMLVGSAAWAIPAQLTVQGQLTNDAGQPGQGSYTLTFALYLHLWAF